MADSEKAQIRRFLLRSYWVDRDILHALWGGAVMWLSVGTAYYGDPATGEFQRTAWSTLNRFKGAGVVEGLGDGTFVLTRFGRLICETVAEEAFRWRQP